MIQEAKERNMKTLGHYSIKQEINDNKVTREEEVLQKGDHTGSIER